MSDPSSIAEDKFAALIETLRKSVSFNYESGGDGYQKSADAMWQAAVAVFEWAASEVGATGFQASWAALQFYSKAMHVNGPFSIVKVEEALYPQYDVIGHVEQFVAEQRPWLAEQAAVKLAEYEANPTYSYTDDDGVEHTGWTVHPDVVAHWRSLIAEPVTS